MKFRFILLSLIAVVTVAGVILPYKAKASSPSDISVTTSPENPTPNSNVTITLSSYVDDLNGVLISWSINGKSSLSGIGQKSFSLTAPALGQQTTVVATLALSDGDVNETIVVKPAIMTLLWEADGSYVPPFYEGKSMPSPESEVKVVAIPEIKSGSSFIDPNNMLYSWSLDDTNDQSNSGYGKNYYTYTSDYLDNSNNVSVTASSIDQQNSATASLNIATVTPKIEFYKNDPNLGTIWEQALSDGSTITNDENVLAAPYFISPADIRIPFLTFAWSINGQSISVPDNTKNMLPLQVQSGKSGISQIGLEVDNIHSLVNTATKEIVVNF
ncbi:MAG: hypothetical protein P4L63_02750 [Candidatus Pacebacteria bacterium]|nr:hypothetical protein [Candidatus Paceibacterota bacterium]